MASRDQKFSFLNMNDKWREKNPALYPNNLNLVHRHSDIENGLFPNNSLHFCANKTIKGWGDEFVGKSDCCV